MIMNTIVLNETQIAQKVKRIAYEILENNFEAETLYLFGIKGNGSALAHELSSILSNICDQKIVAAEIAVNKLKNDMRKIITLVA